MKAEENPNEEYKTGKNKRSKITLLAVFLVAREYQTRGKLEEVGSISDQFQWKWKTYYICSYQEAEKGTGQKPEPEIS